LRVQFLPAVFGFSVRQSGRPGQQLHQSDNGKKDQRTVEFFEIYKRTQGKYSRTLTFCGVLVLGIAGAAALSEKLQGYSGIGPIIQFGVPVLLLLGLAVLMFWIVNRPRSADFLIATEGEMKKVSWSSKKEIIGSTKVVIIATFMMAGILYAVDFMFALLFRAMGVMGA
jgi:preprotein translocase subunit SecE